MPMSTRVVRVNDHNMSYSTNVPVFGFWVSGLFGLNSLSFKSIISAKSAIDSQIKENSDMILRYVKLNIPLLPWMKTQKFK